MRQVLTANFQIRTFQELQASHRCLYSTDHGIYHVTNIVTATDHGLMRIDEEATNSHTFHDAWRVQHLSYADIVLNYTARNLTYPSDMLRAVSGVLYQMYGPRTWFGLPCGDFDRAVLWYTRGHDCQPIASTETDAFPSWSWASFVGPEIFHWTEKSVGLAYWGKVVDVDDVTATPHVDIAVPSETDIASSNAKHSLETNEESFADRHFLAGLAWMAGFLFTNTPSGVYVNCYKAEYTSRVKARWPNYTSYWQDIFGTCQPNSVFAKADIELGSLAGRLRVHTQKASFKTQHNDKASQSRGWIRNHAGRLIGMFELDSSVVEGAVDSILDSVEFIVLSATNGSLGYWVKRYDAFGASIGKLLGCPCLSEKYSYRNAFQPSRTDTQHIKECPHHADFWTPLAHMPDVEDRPAHVVCNKNFMKHFAAVRYFDANGELMHYWDRVPRVNVMMVVPSIGKGRGKGVYQRAGLGWIYLKRWMEAGPSFETVVLE
jgi:hypothetical protein